MLREETILKETRDNIEKYLKVNAIDFLIAFQSMAKEECALRDLERPLLVKLKDHSKKTDRFFEKEFQTNDMILMLETYLDISLCLHMISLRNLEERDMNKARDTLRRGGSLSTIEKDASYLGCTVENVLKSKSLEDYREYKRYFFKRID